MGRWLFAAEAAAVFAIALVARLLYPNPWVHTDEHFHLLASRSLRAAGTLQITPEALPYDRAWGYTYAVAGSQALLGNTVYAARLPSVICGALLVGAVFLFVRRHAGRGAAWVAATLLGFSLPALQMSAMSRFYMPHALAVWLLTWAAYEIVAGGGGGWRRPGWWALLVASTLAAFHLQEMTAIAGLALAVWAGGWGVWAMRRRGLGAIGRRTCAAVAGGAALLVLALWAGGFFGYLWDRYQAPRIWAEVTAGDVRYYHRLMLAWRPLLYVLLPAAVITAARARPGPAVWAATVFGVLWVTHALISPKAERYVFYAMPFFYTVWGIAAQAWIGWLHRTGRTLLLHATLPRATAAAGAGLATAVAVAAPLLLVPEYRTVARLYGGDDGASPYREAAWAEAAAALAPELAGHPFMVGSAGPDVMYHLGRCDVVLSVSAVARREEFAPHERLGRPAISTPESLARLIREHPRGVVVILERHWRSPVHVPDPTADFLEAHLDRLPDPAWGLRVYRWPRAGDGGSR